MLKVIGITLIISVLAACGSKSSAKDIDPKEFEDVCDCSSAIEQIKTEMEAELNAMDNTPTVEQKSSYKIIEKKYNEVYSTCLKRFNMNDMKSCS